MLTQGYLSISQVCPSNADGMPLYIEFVMVQTCNIFLSFIFFLCVENESPNERNTIVYKLDVSCKKGGPRMTGIILAGLINMWSYKFFHLLVGFNSWLSLPTWWTSLILWMEDWFSSFSSLFILMKDCISFNANFFCWLSRVFILCWSLHTTHSPLLPCLTFVLFHIIQQSQFSSTLPVQVLSLLLLRC